MTGGLNIATCCPTANVYEFHVKTIGKYAGGIKNMIYKRYGHASVYAREKVFVFGGFCHVD